MSMGVNQKPMINFSNYVNESKGLSKRFEGSPEGQFCPDNESALNGNDGDCVSSCSSSSIGEISSGSSGNPSTLTSCNEEGSGDMEVQSSFKGPLDTLSSMEDALPIKRGISNFISGKSKSFTNLSDAVSVKDLAKPENPYNKKRRHLLACGNNWDRHRFCPPRTNIAGISKKPMHSSKSTLALAIAMSNSENNIRDCEQVLRLPPLPPLPPRGKFQNVDAAPRPLSLKSFSLTDLQGSAGCHAAQF
jgi:hypothetical protein